MKKKNWLVNIFSILSCFVLTIMLCTPLVSAKYEDSENKLVPGSLVVDKKTNTLKFQIQYQIQVKDVHAYVCDKAYNSPSDCRSNNYSHFMYNKNIGGDPILDVSVMNNSSQPAIYDFVSTGSNSKLATGTNIMDYSDTTDMGPDGKPDNRYKVYITAKFCDVRSNDKNRCDSWNGDEDKTVAFTTIRLETGLTSNGKINKTVADVLNILNKYVMPILWVALGVLLIVRGIMLSMDIVKSSDEPEIRKKKIRGLVWLFVGVALAYVVTIVSSIFIKMFI